jgi:hypothetical protein
VTGTCNALNGCGTTTTTRPCNLTRCIDANTLEEEVGCTGGACQVRIRNCPLGCTTIPIPGCIMQ